MGYSRTENPHRNALLHQRGNQQRHKKDAGDRKSVWEVHRALTPTIVWRKALGQLAPVTGALTSVHEGREPLFERFGYLGLHLAASLGIPDIDDPAKLVHQRNTGAFPDRKTELHTRQRIEGQNLIRLFQQPCDSFT